MKNKTTKTHGATIITGGTSGMGLAIAKLLSGSYPLALIARNRQDLDRVKKLLPEGSVGTYPCDVSKARDVEKTIRQIGSDFGTVSHLVTCAGITYSKPVEEYTEEMFDEEVAVNLKGTFLCVRESWRLMKNGGAIVTFASVRAHTGTPKGSVGYTSAKGGIISLTKTYALQLAPYGIRVNCIAPGAVYPTRISEVWSEEKLKAFALDAPLKRVGTPDDIANAVEFLISDKASYITGHTLDVNGGLWMN